MIVSWKDDAGVTHWGDSNSKEYKRSRKHSEKPAPKPVVTTTASVDGVKRK